MRVMRFITALNAIWKAFRMYENYIPSSSTISALDSLYSEYPDLSWISNFFPPTFPRYKNGKRLEV